MHADRALARMLWCLAAVKDWDHGGLEEVETGGISTRKTKATRG